MIRVNGKALLRIGNKFHAPGEEFSVPEGLAERLRSVGLVEFATRSPKEHAAIRHKGGGWYELPTGEVVRGKENARDKSCESR